MNDLFIIPKPKRFWTTSIVTSILGAVVLTPFLDAHPGLIAIPIVLGSILVVIGQLWDGPTKRPDEQPPQRESAAVHFEH